MKSKNIFLTGKIQIGKSTAISKFLKQNISSKDIVTGFKTKPAYENNRLKGYYIENQIAPPDSSSIENILNFMVGINDDFENGKSCHGITEVFEDKGVEILEKSMAIPNSIILMDELGFFEKKAENFQRIVHKALDSENRVIGVIKERKNDFLESIESREDVLVIKVTLENRNNIVDEIKKHWES